jgi:hypothetical protein
MLTEPGVDEIVQARMSLKVSPFVQTLVRYDYDLHIIAEPRVFDFDKSGLNMVFVCPFFHGDIQFFNKEAFILG